MRIATVSIENSGLNVEVHAWKDCAKAEAHATQPRSKYSAAIASTTSDSSATAYRAAARTVSITTSGKRPVHCQNGSLGVHYYTVIYNGESSACR